MGDIPIPTAGGASVRAGRAGPLPEAALSGKRRLSTRFSALSAAWHGDNALRRRLAHIGHLLAGNYLAALLSLLAVTITARSLGSFNYGMLALTITYTRAIERFISFQSWQPVIKYGASLAGREDHPALRALLKFGLLLDIAACTTAWFVGIMLALLAGALFGWDERTIHLVILYCTVLLFNLNGLPTATLRLAGRFRLVAYGQVLSATARVLLCTLAASMGGDLILFATIWMATQILGSLIFLLTGFRELRRQGVRRILRAPLRGITLRFPGLWSFAWSANLSLTLRSSIYQLDVLLVGALAGPVSAGLYHMAKQIGRLAQQAGVQVQAVVYPDVARLWARQAIAEFRRAIFQTEAMLASFGLFSFLLVFFWAEPLLRWTAGPEFVAAAPLLTVQLGAVMLALSGSAVNSALLAMGRQKQILSVVILATVAFHSTALLLIPRIGPMGANIAHVVFGTIWLICLSTMLRRALRDLPETAPVAAAANPS